MQYPEDSTQAKPDSSKYRSYNSEITERIGVVQENSYKSSRYWSYPKSVPGQLTRNNDVIQEKPFVEASTFSLLDDACSHYTFSEVEPHPSQCARHDAVEDPQKDPFAILSNYDTLMLIKNSSAMVGNH